MAIRIEYTITSGLLPITVELLDGIIVVDTNIHGAYGTYSFEDVPEGGYDIKFTGADGCYATDSVTICDSCPEGYTAYVDLCILYDEQAPTYYSPTFTIVKKVENPAYSVYGCIIFDTWDYDGTGTFEHFAAYPETINTYWANLPYPNTIGVLNRTAVWANVTYDFQDIGFSFCINIAVAKTYYVGFGCDNWGKIKLNGTMILEQDRPALMAMVAAAGLSGGTDIGTPHKYWWIYPVYLPAGQNVIEVFGRNEYLVAAVGIQIYDATKQDLINATSDADLAGQILFSSEQLVGETLQYEYSTGHGYHGYVCNAGYALSTCGESYLCIQRDELPCGATPSTTTSTSSTTTTTTTVIPSIWMLAGNGTYDIYTSEDLVTFTPTTIAMTEGRFAAYGNGVWLAGGSSLSTSNIYYSTDTITWNLATSVFTTACYGAVWNGSKWIAVGNGTYTMATSPDGITWTEVNTSPFSHSGYNIIWDGSQFIAVGRGTNAIAYSSDGVTWTGDGLTTFTQYGQGVFYNGSLYVAVGFGTNDIAYSNDGHSWTVAASSPFTTQGVGIAYGNGIWLATGSGTYTTATSPDGINWTGRETLGTAGYTAKFADNKFLVGFATGASVWRTTTDGISYSNISYFGLDNGRASTYY